MEMYYMATGPMRWLKEHELHMQSREFFIQGLAPNGQTFQQPVFGMLEPINLYRYVFPKEALPIVAKTLKADENNPLFDKLKVQTWAMRKALGLKDYPKTGLPAKGMPVPTQHLQVIPIGIKEDEVGLIEPTGVTQEKV